MFKNVWVFPDTLSYYTATGGQLFSIVTISLATGKLERELGGSWKFPFGGEKETHEVLLMEKDKSLT